MIDGNTTKQSYTTARVLYYPPLPSVGDIKPGQLRCGEHVDYGSITLLFQDPNGGLQVWTYLLDWLQDYFLLGKM